jgi:hypothetical protein
MRARYAKDTHTGREGVTIFCPGCESHHVVWIKNPDGPVWRFNKDLNAPTFHPSLHIKTGHHVTGSPAAQCEYCIEDAADGEPLGSLCSVCHSIITDGRIQFLTDCTHALAGQTVDLPELPYHQGSAS